MELFCSAVISIIAGVVTHVICKLLDGKQGSN